MALTHATPGQAIDVGPLGSCLQTEQTTALFKSRDLAVMRLVLTTGRSFPPHSVAGEVTIQCLEGTLAIELADMTVKLDAGQLLFLSGEATHGVRALTDASALITIALKS